MKALFRHTFGLVMLVLTCSMFLAAANVHAEVTAIRSQINSMSTEFVDGEPGSTDQSIEDFPNTSSQLPIESLSGLGNFDGGSESVFGARGIATFRDPALSPVANPGEWGVEADCFSLDPSRSYEVSSEIVEERDIVFTESDLSGFVPQGGTGETGSDSEEPLPGDVMVRSNVFANGGVLVWADDPSGDLSGLDIQMIVIITQVGGSSSTAGEEVFRAAVDVTGAPNGEVSVSTQGGLIAITDGPGMLLSSNIIGIDGAIEQLQSTGNVRLVILPGQVIPYQYAAQPDDPFTLEARVLCRVNNQPGGTGVAAVFGRPFRALSSVIAPKISDKSADITQSAMNRIIAEANETGVIETPTPRGCGVLGMVMPVVLLCGLAASRRR